MDFYKIRYPKARKKHICEYCGKEIQIGDTYCYEVGKFEGDMYTRKLCLSCNNILHNFVLDNCQLEFDWWQVSDWLRDNHCCNCEHKNDCSYQVPNCPVIRERFEEIKV